MRTTPRHTLNLVVIALVVGAGITTLGIAMAPRADYRVEGARLLDRSTAISTGATPLREALRDAALPAPILMAAAADAVFGDVARPLRSQAAFGAIALGLAAMFVVLAAGRLAGTWGALSAGLLMVGAPGTLFHARTLGPEALVALGWSGLILASTFQRRTSGPTYLAAASLAFLVALGSAHEALLFAIPWLLSAFVVPMADAPPAAVPGLRPLPSVSLGALLPVVVGPALLIALWPHLHEQLGTRLLALLFDPMKAPHPAVLVGGETFDQALNQAPPFFHALWLVVLRLPPMLVLLSVLGAALIIRAARRGHTERHGVFAVFGAATYLIVFGLNGGPEYDGLDGIMALVPFLAVVGGIGAAAIVDLVEESLPTLSGGVLGRVVVLAVVGSVPFDTAMSWPLEPAYRSAWIGGTRGAAEHGYDTLPDGFLAAAAVEWMNQNLPMKARLAVEPPSDRYRALLESLRARGVLRNDIESSAPYHATHALVTRRPGAFLYRDTLETLGPPLATFDHGGTQALGIYLY